MERFVGRTDQLRRLEAVCAAALARRGGLVVVSGVAGIGKTRLCEEAADRAGRAGFTVAWGRCWPDGGAPPLWPWQSVLNQLCGPEAAAILDSDAGPATADPERFSRFVKVGDLLGDACTRGPVLVVLDDLHTADPGAVLLARFVARALHRLPVVLVITRRHGEGDLGDLEREGTLIALPDFDLDETRAFLTVHGLADFDPDLALGVLRVTGGNPLFLRRIVALGRPGATALPDGLRGAIAEALDRIDPGMREVLATAAVLGPTSSVAEAAAVSRVSPVTMLETLDRAEDMGLVVDLGPGRFGFSHEVVRATLEAALPPAHRLDAHARAAGVGGEPVTAERLARRAHHALQAAARSPEDARLAVAACAAASRSMVRNFAYEQAAALLAVAAGLAEQDGPVPAALLVDRARAVLLCGRLAEARLRFDQAAAAADREGDPALLAEAALGLGGVWVDEHRTPVERERVLGLQRRALDSLPPEQAVLRCRLKTRLAAEAVCTGGPAQAVADAVTHVRRLGDGRALAEALSLWHHVLLTPEHTHARLAVADELIAVASSAGEGVLALMGLCWRTVDLFHLGDPRGGRALAELRERADALGCRSILYIVNVLDVMLLIRAGALEEAEAQAQRCHRLGTEVGDADALGYHGAQLVVIRWLQGRGTELLDLVEEMTVSSTLMRKEFGFRAAAASLAADAGRRDRARTALAALATHGLAALPVSSSWLVGMQGIVDAAATLGESGVAGQAYDLLLPYADLPVMVSLGVACLGSVERPLGLAAMTLGHYDRAVRHLERAVDANGRLGNRPLAAVAQADLAGALRRRGAPGDRGRAAALLEAATADARSMGMTRRAEAWQGRRDALSGARSGTLRREGRGWVVALDDHRVLVGDLAGMGYLARLVAQPGVEIPALVLAGGNAVAPEPSRQTLLDDRARAAYARRATQLAADLAVARETADRARVERLEAEVDALAAQLDDARGLGGRSRAFTGPGERARTAVRKAITRAIHEIDAADPEIAGALRPAIRTGSRCSYLPGGPVTWSI